MHQDVLIIIPARIGSMRLPKKFIATIGKHSMAYHVVQQVNKTQLPKIYVATDSELIAEEVTKAGGNYIMTSESCATGTDRVFEAVNRINDPKIQYIVNVQGDMPFVDPKTILALVENLKNSSYDIVTPVVKATKEEADSSSKVKAVVDNNNKALFFSRNLIPSAATEFLLHVGMYGFKKSALEKFVKCPVSFLEKNESNLEQLRALENNLTIGVFLADSVPISIDTPEDLEKAREYYDKISL